MVELDAAVARRAGQLLDRFPLRASDAIQLASALRLAAELRFPVTFAAFDDRLCAAAAAEGMPLLDR